MPISDEWQGSPPHTRGKHISELKSTIADRIIPAYAGKTISFSLQKGENLDHPRIRGENSAILP